MSEQLSGSGIGASLNPKDTVLLKIGDMEEPDPKGETCEGKAVRQPCGDFGGTEDCGPLFGELVSWNKGFGVWDLAFGGYWCVMFGILGFWIRPW